MSSRLRLVSAHDVVELAEVLRHNRGFLAPWEPLREESYFTVPGQRADIDAVLMRHERGDAVPLVILDDDGTIAGRLTLNGIARGPFQSCSMGYWLAENRTGRGLATQAVQAAVSLALSELGLHRVQAETLPNNAAARRVLAKTGFQEYRWRRDI